MADTNVDKRGCIHGTQLTVKAEEDVCQHIITATKQLNVHTATVCSVEHKPEY